MLIDDVTITLAGGNGGNGFRGFSKVKQTLGPTGSDGGNGGNIYFEGVSDLGALIQFKHTKSIQAPHGESGNAYLRDGKDGEDLILKVPVGSVITNLETGHTIEITAVGERALAIKGGKGGRGNYKFRSPTNTSPWEFEEGKPGERADFRLELKLIADIGLIGFPNSGKSSLLNEVTGAKSRVANYPFTTLEPHLGVYYELILADIPGLIEGASSGKGLGAKFLKHIERTNILFHLISSESDDVARDYTIIREELKQHNILLADRMEYVFLTKTDMVSPETREEQLAALRAIGLDPVPISLLEPASVENVKRILNELQKQKLETGPSA